MRNHYNSGAILDAPDEMKKHPLYKKALKVWGSMWQRCNDPKLHQVEETYIGCKVCDEWKSFIKFFEWFCDNYYTIENESVQLDKDILLKGNKLYSPDTCCFVPHTINSLLTKSDRKRGKYPIGVTWITRDRVYRAQCMRFGKTIALGEFSTPEEAFYAYKKYKENVIKEVADKYKPLIPGKVYEALYNYEVDITD